MFPINNLSYRKLREASLASSLPVTSRFADGNDESEHSEINTDAEADDVMMANSNSSAGVGKRKSDKNHASSGLFGSLLDLSCKLKEADKRFKEIFASDDSEGILSEQPASSGPDVANFSNSNSAHGFEKYRGVSDGGHGHNSRHDGSAAIAELIRRNNYEGFSRNINFMNQDYKHTGLGNNSKSADDHELLASFRQNSSGMFATGGQSGSLVATRAEHAREPDSMVLSERRKHRCTMCAYQTDNISHLRRHQCTVHNADKLYHCYVCGMDFSRSERAKAHFLTIHPEIPYHSKIARKRPAEPSDDTAVVRNMMVGNAAYQSNDSSSIQKNVPSSISMKKSWEKYCQLVAPSNTCDSYHFQCLQCDFQGTNIWHLKRHYLDTHVTTGSYSCRVCHYSTGDVQRLISHMTGHGELFCSRCPFSTVELERFRMHLLACTESGTSEVSQCPVCGDEFTDRMSVKGHVAIVHQRDYCETCGCVIYGMETMEEHQRQHANSDSKATGGAGSSSSNLINPVRSEILDLASNKMQQNGADTGLEQDENESQMGQVKIRFGRFSNQVYYCPFSGCGFKATWKKSVELHTLNYHGCGNVDEQMDNGQPTPDQSSGIGGANGSLDKLFNCAFCPNFRTFKYRKSFEKHLLQHGIDYERHPYLVVRSSQSDSFGIVTID